MTVHCIELLGGSADGRIAHVDGDPIEIRTAERIALPKMPWGVDGTLGVKPTIREVRYLRTERFNEGRRIYCMQGLKA